MTDPLDGIRLFEGVSELERADLLASLTRRRIRGGETLIHEGEPAQNLYFAVYGRFEVFRSGLADPVAQIGPGEPIGEIAFFAGGPRTASVMASRDSEVVVLSREDFDRLADAHPHLHRIVTGSLAARLSEASELLRPLPKAPAPTLFVCPTHDGPLPRAAMELLFGEFDGLARIRILRDEKALAVSGATGFDDPALLHALHECERENDLVLFLADGDSDPGWRAFALRQSDGALIVACGSKPETRGKIESSLDADIPPSRRRLIVPEADAYPASRWLANRNVATHHRLVAAEDAASIARFLTGRARGLVLGGGGALCGAHIGMYFALHEAGCRFDYFGGASAGGAVGAALAAGLSRQQMVHATTDIFLAAGSFRKWTLPQHALLDPSTFDAKLEEHYGAEPMENLPRAAFVIVSDLMANAPRVVSTGPVWEAVRSTCSIPALLPPFIDETGSLLLDGGVTDNLPVLPMRERKTGPNAAILLELPYPDRCEARYADTPRRGRQLLEAALPWIRPKRERPPTLAPVLTRTILLAANARMAQSVAEADLALRPPIPRGMGILDWHRFEAHEAETFDWARNHLQTLPEEALAPFRD